MRKTTISSSLQTHRLVFLTLSLLAIRALYAQDSEASTTNELVRNQVRAALESENPTSLFSVDIDDATVELLLFGSWKSAIGGYLSIGSDGSPQTFAGFANTPWTNTVDLSISLWIMERYFFEFVFADAFTFNTFLLGYENPDPEAMGLIHAYLGNARIGIGKYPNLTFSDAVNNGIGISTLWAFNDAEIELLVRLSNTERVVERFLGTRPVQRQVIASDAYIRNRFFQLPYTAVRNVTVWLEDSSGTTAPDGHSYRMATVSDILFIDQGKGVFGLKERHTGRIRVAFSKSADSTAVSFPALDSIPEVDLETSFPYSLTAGSNFDQRVLDILVADFGWETQDFDEITIEGNETILVAKPGLFSIFEDSSWYELPQSEEISSVHLSNGTLRPVFFVQEQDVLRVLPTELLSVHARYPIASYEPDSFAQIYMKTGYQLPVPDLVLWSAPGEKAASVSISKPAVPHSLLVYRDGALDPGAVLGNDGRTLHFSIPVRDGEQIIVEYNSSDTEQGTQFLDIGIGAHVRMDLLTLGAGLGLQWPIATAVQATETSIPKGILSLGLSADLNNGEDLSLHADVGASLFLPNAGNALLVQDFSSRSLSIIPQYQNLLPSRAPEIDDLEQVVDGGTLIPALGISTSTLTRETFVIPRYREARDGSGGLMPWDSFTGDAVVPGSGSAIGPYLAAASAGDPVDSQVIVVELKSDSEAEHWSSIEVRLTDDQRGALSQSGRFSFSYAGIDMTKSIELFVQIGDLDEDIDNDGNLRAGTPGLRGIPFLLPDESSFARSAYPIIATEGNIPTEDLENDGLNRNENQASHYITYIGTIDVDENGTWVDTVMQVPEAVRHKLYAARAVRFFFWSENQNENLTAKILLQRIRTTLPAMAVQTSGISSAKATITADIALEDELLQSFPENLPFHSSLSESAHQTLDWDTAGEGTAIFDQPVTEFSFSDYEKFQVFIRGEPGNSSDISLRLVSKQTTGNVTIAEALFPVPALQQWYKVELDYYTSLLRVIDENGITVTEIAATTKNSQYPSVDSVQFAVETPGSATLTIDDISLVSAIPGMVSTFSIAGAWHYRDVILTLDDFILLENIRFSTSFSGQLGTRIVETESEAGVPPLLHFQTSAGLVIAYTDIGMGLLLSWQDPYYTAAGYHDIQFPYGIQSPLTIRNHYDAGFSGELRDRKNESAVSITFPGYFSYNFGVQSVQSREAQSQLYSTGVTLGDVQKWGGTLTGSLFQTSDSPGLDDALWSYDYLQSWFDSFLLYAPFPAADIDGRNIILGSDLYMGIEKAPAQFHLSLQSESRQGVPLPHHINLDLSTETEIGNDEMGFELSIQYSRSSSFQLGYLPESFGDELFRTFETVGLVQPAWLGVPFYELFSIDHLPNLTDSAAGIDYLSVNPRFKIALRRNIDTEWTALVIPRQYDLGIERISELRTDLTEDHQFLDWGLGWTAINMLGRYGMYPVFDFYESDQLDFGISGMVFGSYEAIPGWMFSGNIAISLLGISSGEKESGDWQKMQESALPLIDLGPPESIYANATSRILQTDKSAPLSWSNTLSFSWSWSIPTDLNEVHLFGNIISTEPYFLNKESLTVAYTDDVISDLLPSTVKEKMGAILSDQIQDWSLVIGHRTVFLLPGFGYLSGRIDAGLRKGNITGQVVLGLQIHVEARILF